MERTQGRPTSVASVEVVKDAVLPLGKKAYIVALSCGCSFAVIDPPDSPPLIGAMAVCYSADGCHLVAGRRGPVSELLGDLGVALRRLFSRLR